jgi:hypothetical protein
VGATDGASAPVVVFVVPDGSTGIPHILDSVVLTWLSFGLLGSLLLLFVLVLLLDFLGLELYRILQILLMLLLHLW